MGRLSRQRHIQNQKDGSRRPWVGFHPRACDVSPGHLLNANRIGKQEMPAGARWALPCPVPQAGGSDSGLPVLRTVGLGLHEGAGVASESPPPEPSSQGPEEVRKAEAFTPGSWASHPTRSKVMQGWVP